MGFINNLDSQAARRNRNVKKRLLSAMFASVMCLTVVACGNGTSNPSKDGTETKNPSGEQVALTFSCWGGELDVKTYQERADLLQKKFSDMNLEVMNLPSDGYDTKVQTMLASNEAPDIIQIAESSNSYASKGIFTDVGKLAEDSGLDLDKRFGGATESYIWQDKLYAIPDRGGAMVLYYNRDMFDAAGVEYPTKNWTWKEFLNAAQTLTITGDDGVISQYGFAAGGWWPWWMSFMYQNGGRILDEKMENVIVNSPENIEAINFYTDLVHKYKVAPTADDYSRFGLKDGQPDPLFAQGHTAMCMTGYWNIGSLSSVEDINWDIAPLWKNKESATFAFGSGLAIPEDCKTKEDAFKAIEFLTSEEGQKPIVTNNQDAPANIDLLRSDLFLNPDWAKDKDIHLSAFADSADMMVSPPLHPKWNEILRVFDENFSVLFQQGGDSSETIANIQSQLENAIK
jgi:multiple sugar transport system substrate-binding protein